MWTRAAVVLGTLGRFCELFGHKINLLFNAYFKMVPVIYTQAGLGTAFDVWSCKGETVGHCIPRRRLRHHCAAAATPATNAAAIINANSKCEILCSWKLLHNC